MNNPYQYIKEDILIQAEIDDKLNDLKTQLDTIHHEVTAANAKVYNSINDSYEIISVLKAELIKPQEPPKPSLPTRLLKSEDLAYEGAFRFPQTSSGSSFNYGGWALAFCPERETLFTVGHDWHQKVAEIGVPNVIRSGILSNLSVAGLRQSFYDVTDKKMFTIDEPSSAPKIGGLLCYGGELYGTVYSYYDSDRSAKLSHFISPYDLSNSNDAEGMFEVGGLGAGFVAGYMCKVPAEWVDALGGEAITGQGALAIVGRTSLGPAAFVFDPEDVGNANPAPVVPLVYYPIEHPTLGEWGKTSNLYNGSTTLGGCVIPKGTASLLFFGTQGIGDWHYGEVDEKTDPENRYQGGHAYPYRYQIWAYDLNELRQLTTKPWDKKPYAVWELKLPFSVKQHRIGGVAYDEETGRIFVSQMYADGDRPVIHVFTVNPQA